MSNSPRGAKDRIAWICICCCTLYCSP